MVKAESLLFSPTSSSPPTMSGKAPPRAPRALLTSLAHANAASSSSTSSNTTPNTSTTVRHSIPTGPRSLTNGGIPRPKSFLNGFSTPVPSLKGKEVDYGDTGILRQEQSNLTTVCVSWRCDFLKAFKGLNRSTEMNHGRRRRSHRRCHPLLCNRLHPRPLSRPRQI